MVGGERILLLLVLWSVLHSCTLAVLTETGPDRPSAIFSRDFLLSFQHHCPTFSLQLDPDIPLRDDPSNQNTGGER